MIGFVASGSFEFWENEINDWLETLAKNDTFWNIDEKLEIKENNAVDSFLQSIGHRKATDDIAIYHFWIKI